MLGGATPNWAFWAVAGRRVTAVGCCGCGIAGIVIVMSCPVLFLTAGAGHARGVVYRAGVRHRHPGEPWTGWSSWWTSTPRMWASRHRSWSITSSVPARTPSTRWRGWRLHGPARSTRRSRRPPG